MRYGFGIGLSFTRRYPNQAPPGAPVATQAPVIASSSANHPATLSVTSTATWTQNPTSKAYQWTKNGAAYGSSTSAPQDIATDGPGNYRLTETATNANGSNFSNSNTLAIAAALTAPVNTQAPVVSGTTTQGQTLTTTNGTWTGNPAPTYTYQWRRNGADISGATAQTYVLVAADVGTNITCAVTGSNSQGSVTAVSNSVGPIAAAATAPARMTAPVLSASPNAISVDRANSTADGGSAITRYDLRYSTDSAFATSTTVEQTTDPQTVSGLTNGTLYYVQTRAVNAVGAGEWSPSASATPQAAAPTSFSDDFNRADDTGIASASPNWRLLSGNGGGLRVTNGKLQAAAAEGAFASPNLGSVNHSTRILIEAVNANVGPFVCCRLVDQNNFGAGVRFNTSSGAVQLWKREAGTLTMIGSGTGAAPGKMLEVQVVGDNAQVMLDGVVVIGPTAMTGASATATDQGLLSRTVAINPFADNYFAQVITALAA